MFKKKMLKSDMILVMLEVHLYIWKKVRNRNQLDQVEINGSKVDIVNRPSYKCLGLVFDSKQCFFENLR